MRTKQLQTMIEDARASWSADDTGADHIWVMPRRLGAGGMVPVCLFCGVTTLGAQQSQPESKGVGPCEKRIAYRSLPLIEEPKRAVSMSEFRRVKAQGGDILPPLTRSQRP